MRFIETVFQKLKRHPKRIVFPEGTEPRVLRAAARFVKLQLGAPVVLGRKEEIEKVALGREASASITSASSIRATSSELPTFVKRLEKLKRYRDLGPKQAAEILANPNYFGAMMVQYGQVDGLVTGARETASSALRPLIQLIKPLPDDDEHLELHDARSFQQTLRRARRHALRRLRGHPRADRRAARRHRRADGHDLPPAHRQQTAHRDAQLFDQGQREAALAAKGRRGHRARAAEGARSSARDGDRRRTPGRHRAARRPRRDARRRPASSPARPMC